jgi:hypothetical protein
MREVAHGTCDSEPLAAPKLPIFHYLRATPLAHHLLHQLGEQRRFAGQIRRFALMLVLEMRL